MDLFTQPDEADDADHPEEDDAGAPAVGRPLADRMRPREFSEVQGQEELIGPGAFLARLIGKERPPSLILWGPPGCGKTTLAMLIARRTGMAFQALSAVTSGIREVKRVIDSASARLELKGRRTILFVDEIHRFNKAQQDAFLPHVERGTVILIGATTENPSFSVIAPLLSRCRVFTLKPLGRDDLVRLLRRAVEDRERGLGSMNLRVPDETLEALAAGCDGDARRCLNLLEQCADAAMPAAETDADGDAEPAPLVIDDALLAEVSRRTHLIHDKAGEEHFNLISALHKSLRASDEQAALYWMARMLAAGDDPLYVGRRLVRFASEDVGLADPQALAHTLAAVESYRMLGTPEGELALVQAVVYLATCPKSNSLYTAWKSVTGEIGTSGALPVPVHLRNAPTGLMKSLGYGREYQYDHDSPDGFSGQPCLPGEIEGRRFYTPGSFGHEREIAKRLEWWNARRRERSGPDGDAKKRRPKTD